jgi:riboflavin transporter FmnP
VIAVLIFLLSRTKRVFPVAGHASFNFLGGCKVKGLVDRMTREPETARDAENYVKGFVSGIMLSCLIGLVLFYFGSLSLFRAIAEVSIEHGQKVEVQK